MGIKQREDAGIVIFDVSGRLAIGEGDAQIREAVKGALADGHTRLLLNLGGVKTVDSSGVGELVSAHSSVSTAGGSLRLAALSPKVAAVLQATRLVGVLDIHETEEEAMLAFVEGSGPSA